MRRIEALLHAAAAARSDVVRTRILLIDISRCDELGTVHTEVFGDTGPMATLVKVSALIAPELFVEIAGDAYAPALGVSPVE